MPQRRVHLRQGERHSKCESSSTVLLPKAPTVAWHCLRAGCLHARRWRVWCGHGRARPWHSVLGGVWRFSNSPALHLQASPPTRRASTAAAPLADAARTQRPATQRRGLHATPVASALPAHQVLEMPALSPTMEEGTITEWLVQPGDEIAAGDAIANLETDKAVMSARLHSLAP